MHPLKNVRKIKAHFVGEIASGKRKRTFHEKKRLSKKKKKKTEAKNRKKTAGETSASSGQTSTQKNFPIGDLK